jgi:hypothetical protein
MDRMDSGDEPTFGQQDIQEAAPSKPPTLEDLIRRSYLKEELQSMKKTLIKKTRNPHVEVNETVRKVIINSIDLVSLLYFQEESILFTKVIADLGATLIQFHFFY